MGYLHQPFLISTMAYRKGRFDRFIEGKKQGYIEQGNPEIIIAVTILEDAEIGGYEYDKAKIPDFSKKEDILKQVEEKSISKIEEMKSYSSRQKAKLRAIFERLRTDETFYNIVVKEYEEFLNSFFEVV